MNFKFGEETCDLFESCPESECMSQHEKSLMKNTQHHDILPNSRLKYVSTSKLTCHIREGTEGDSTDQEGPSDLVLSIQCHLEYEKVEILSDCVSVLKCNEHCLARPR